MYAQIPSSWQNVSEQLQNTVLFPRVRHSPVTFRFLV
jgi:hypothetical protein